MRPGVKEATTTLKWRSRAFFAFRTTSSFKSESNSETNTRRNFRAHLLEWPTLCCNRFSCVHIEFETEESSEFCDSRQKESNLGIAIIMISLMTWTASRSSFGRPSSSFVCPCQERTNPAPVPATLRGSRRPMKKSEAISGRSGNAQTFHMKAHLPFE